MNPALDRQAVLANPPGHWFAGAATAVIVFAGMMQYHAWWRAKPWSWTTTSECLALAAFAVLALCLLAGPLRRLGLLPASVAAARRPLAISGAVCAGLHGLATLLIAPGAGWVLQHPWSFAISLAAAAAIAALAATSWPSAMQRLGAERWHRLHLLAGPALAATTLHVLVLGKVAKWESWWVTGDLPAPPGTLPMAVLAVVVLLLRSVDALARARRSPLRAVAETGALLAVLAALAWGFARLPARTPPAAPPPPAAAAPAPAAVPAGELIILCGTSMSAPTEELARLARAQGLAVRLDFGGSETLLPRVLAGERADLLVSHDPFPAKLQAAGRLRRAVPVGGLQPVLAVAKGNPRRLAGLADLAGAGLRIGLPDARYSTCGEYVRARLREGGIEAAVQERVVVEQRSHQELATALRLGSIDAAVLWNFIGVQNASSLDVIPLPGPWPETRVKLCILQDAAPAVERLLAASPDLTALYARFGFALAP